MPASTSTTTAAGDHSLSASVISSSNGSGTGRFPPQLLPPASHRRSYSSGASALPPFAAAGASAASAGGRSGNALVGDGARVLPPHSTILNWKQKSLKEGGGWEMGKSGSASNLSSGNGGTPPLLGIENVSVESMIH